MRVGPQHSQNIRRDRVNDETISQLDIKSANNGRSEMRRDRLIIGLLCIAFAVWTFLSQNTIGPAIGIGILGLITLVIARKKS